MPRNAPLGEFEQLLMLAILRLREDAYSLAVRRELEQRAHRTVSRGAFYATLDRLESKGLVKWKSMPPTDSRGGMPQRRFEVTPAGIHILQTSRETLLDMWHGLESVLETSR
jgi:DNA-binding PadR family transcriptional regulator